MLQLDGLHLQQGSFTLQADLTCAPGVTAILGPSGAGKSTLLNSIAGFLCPRAGRILWQGRDLTPLSPAKRPVAMLFQDNNLFPHLSIAANLALALTRGRPDASQRTKIAKALAEVELDGLGDRRPAALSGGQQSRAALARALLQDRPLLLLDEPFSALGPALKQEMLDRVADAVAARDLTCLMITHDPADARRIACRSLVVAEGRAAPPQATTDLLAKPPLPLAAYLGQG